LSATQKAQSPAATGQSANQKTDHAIVAPAEKTGKPSLTRDPRFEHLQQRFALCGFTMNASATGSSVYVSRWGLVRFFDTLPEAEAFALQVGADR
jgi:hypothetical protein